MLSLICPKHSHWKWIWPENKNELYLKSASLAVIMLLHKGLTHIHSQKKPRLHFSESFTLSCLLCSKTAVAYTYIHSFTPLSNHISSLAKMYTIHYIHRNVMSCTHLSQRRWMFTIHYIQRNIVSPSYLIGWQSFDLTLLRCTICWWRGCFVSQCTNLCSPCCIEQHKLHVNKGFQSFRSW